MRDLIERLERAEGPIIQGSDKWNRIGALALAAGLTAEEMGALGRAIEGSLDAALTLVPPPVVKSDKGRKIEIIYSEWIPQASVTVNYQYTGFARTPAIALVIAALKAREAGNG